MVVCCVLSDFSRRDISFKLINIEKNKSRKFGANEQKSKTVLDIYKEIQLCLE